MRNQNWVAIAIEFVIVVFGVFLGIQLGDWNNDRKERAEYRSAVARLDSEMRANEKAFEAVDGGIRIAIGEVRAATDALDSCTQDAASRAAVNTALATIIGTEGFHLRKTALADLTSDPALLRHQPDPVRARLSDLQFTTDIALSEGRFYEAKPLEVDVAALPATAIGGRRDRDFAFFDANGEAIVEEQARPELALPLPQACQDNELRAAFWTWERYQANIPMLTAALRREYAATREVLGLPSS